MFRHNHNHSHNRNSSEPRYCPQQNYHHRSHSRNRRQRQRSSCRRYESGCHRCKRSRPMADLHMCRRASFQRALAVRHADMDSRR